jgi:NitT/TauT family transport system substrate-binding protein
MRRTLSAAIAAAALLLTAACGGGGSSTDADAAATPAAGAPSSAAAPATPDKVTVGVIPIVDVAPIYLGKEKGFFTEQNIDLELVKESGGAAAVPGVVSGQFQFAFGNVVSLIVARAQGIPLKAIADGNASTGKEGADFSGVVVPADSPIKTAADLEGKTVSVNNLKNVGDTTVRAAIRKAGGDPAKVKFVELGFPDMPAAIANKRVDAAWVVEPFLTVAKSQGARVIAWNMVDAAPGMEVAVYATTEKMINEKADLTKRFTAAIEKSLAYAESHPDEARAILLTYTKIDDAASKALTLPAWPSAINKESVQTLADLMLGDKLIDKKIDVTELLP